MAQQSRLCEVDPCGSLGGFGARGGLMVVGTRGSDGGWHTQMGRAGRAGTAAHTQGMHNATVIDERGKAQKLA